MDAFSEEEQLDGDEKYFCEKCDQHQPATKWLRVHQYPKVRGGTTSVSLRTARNALL
jgi:ubiquitin C-terminal hydrolase